MIRPDRRLRLCAALLILNLCFIWGNSLLSAEQSRAFSDWVMELLFSGRERELAQGAGTGLLRKAAHFLEFATLGGLLGWLGSLLDRKRPWPLHWGVLTACVDETIQCFVPGRGPAVRDVLIDSCGLLTGMALLQIGYVLWKKKQS